MAYATVEDFVAYYGLEDALVSADRENDHVIDPVAIQKCLVGSSSLIDGFLAKSDAIVLPLNETPDSIHQACLEITNWQISQNTGAASEGKEKRAMFWLKYWLPMVSEDKVGIGDPVEPVPSKFKVQFTGVRAVFTRKSMAGLM